MPKKRIWTSEEVIQIISWYVDDGFTISYIAKTLLHCREGFISQLLRDNNIEIRKQSSGRVINVNLEKEIISLYTEKRYSQRQIAEKYSCSTFVIHNILVRNNVPIVIQPQINKNQNDTYFDTIDNEHKAYWLGFIFANGNVFNNQLSLEIHERDIALLEQFKQDLNLNSKISIRHRENTDICCIRVSSAHMCESLAKYGIVPNKTKMTKHLPAIDSQWLPHFLRGLVDGDGWITQDRHGYFHIGFVSNYQSTCEDFKKYCNIITDELCQAKITYKDANNTSCFQIQNKEAVKRLATALYKGNTICLSRKYQKAALIFDLKNDEDIV